MEAQILSQEEPKKMLKNPSALLRPPRASFFCTERGPAHLLVKQQRSCEVWADLAADDGQPQEGKATEQKGKYKKDIAAFRAKGKPGTVEKEVVRESLKRGGGRQK